MKNCKVSPEVVVPATSEAKEKSDDGSSDEDVDIMTISDNEILDCESYISEESCTSQKLKSASSCSSLTVHACTYEGCDKFFSRPSRLNQHIRTHTGEVSIMLCHVCRALSLGFGFLAVFFLVGQGQQNLMEETADCHVHKVDRRERDHYR